MNTKKTFMIILVVGVLVSVSGHLFSSEETISSLGEKINNKTSGWPSSKFEKISEMRFICKCSNKDEIEADIPVSWNKKKDLQKDVESALLQFNNECYEKTGSLLNKCLIGLWNGPFFASDGPW